MIRASSLIILSFLATAPTAQADVSPATAGVSATPADEVAKSSGQITVAGRTLGYQAEAGLMVVHVKDPNDADPVPAGEKAPPVPPSAAMSYVAYFLGKEPDARRPITFIYNGGPGSATIWLHMGAFGPKRAMAADAAHGAAAPYRLIDNAHTLLPDSDLVFIDAPATGFGFLRGAEKEKAFLGIDEDGRAFTNFIMKFLSTHGRWNSPKFLFGESYGTTRSAVLANMLTERAVELNGVILLSQILSFDNSADNPDTNPGVDQPYALALPSYAATAWYHHKLANRPESLETFLAEVERFALDEYLPALNAGRSLSAERRAAIVAKLHDYTGIAPGYLEKADLRLNVGMFDQQLLGDTTTGRLDTRYTGPAMDPVGREASYDPMIASIAAPYVALFNDYVRKDLHFGEGRTYKYMGGLPSWDNQHAPPGAGQKLHQTANVMPDLAAAMKQNPNLKVQMHGGYYDLATPYFSAKFELNHLQIPTSLAQNLSMHFYPTGHMVYLNEPSLAALAQSTAAFIRANSVH
jgi:carboxypeptidase C (cathepsin A)